MQKSLTKPFSYGKLFSRKPKDTAPMRQDIPVLLIIFNRSWHLQRVMAALQKIRPARLFVAGDGPRNERPGEELCCKEAQETVLNAVNWPCEVHSCFQKENLGCGRHVTRAVSWFFENVEEGIILEDDCVPSEAFFAFAGELLERYRNTPEVMMISGTALVKSPKPTGNDYEFLSFPCCWGWAAWRRSWALMSYDMPDFPAYRRSKEIEKSFPARHVRRRLLELFSKVYHHAPGFDTWDFQWLYACVKNNGLCILPCANLVSNIGWDASHDRIDEVMELPFEEITEIRHPSEIRRNVELEKIFFEKIYKKAPFIQRLFNKIRKLISRGKR